MIVMGTHGYGTVKHMVLGSVAERVVRTANCPVLTIRHPDETAHDEARQSMLSTAI
jgi:nucleotide-binding universal stress UspA family protein